MRIRTDYLKMLFVPDFLEGALVNAEGELRGLDFEVIACRGVSGIGFASILAYRMSKGLLVVRKPGEGSHSEYREVEGCYPNKGGGWIIVDDLISTGNTVISIYAAVRRNAQGCENLLGVYLYVNGVFRDIDDLAGYYGILL
jgi:adenine/guanine phosphoribosyltransferase-like PRPP-binding protein